MVKKAVKKEKEADKAVGRYFESRGGRKTAVARVRLVPAKSAELSINGKEFKAYFKDFYLQKEVLQPLEVMNVLDRMKVSVKVAGGGLHSQAKAVSHGIARALVLFNPDFRKRLRRNGLLTRDARMVERKKYGLKKARRAPQWAKR